MAQKPNVVADQIVGQIPEAEAVESRRVADANFDQAVANPQTPPTRQPSPPGPPSPPIPPGPVLQEVKAGDLITCEYINQVVRAIQNLQTRVGNLETRHDSPPPNHPGAAAL
ncbi:MAG: hypothetical protein QOJ94_1589 [Sphingomonadales bacterium]|jgi:hypothetical protein|nr:hypothetical protein [Sphingomonadales bacterium]